MSFICKLLGHNWTVGFHIDRNYNPSLILKGNLCDRCGEFTASKDDLHKKINHDN